jgi:hypothetical protein
LFVDAAMTFSRASGAGPASLGRAPVQGMRNGRASGHRIPRRAPAAENVDGRRRLILWVDCDYFYAHAADGADAAAILNRPGQRFGGFRFPAAGSDVPQEPYALNPNHHPDGSKNHSDSRRPGPTLGHFLQQVPGRERPRRRCRHFFGPRGALRGGAPYGRCSRRRRGLSLPALCTRRRRVRAGSPPPAIPP